MNIIVTGVTSGVGLAIVKRIMETTEYHVIGLSRGEKKLENLKNTFKERFSYEPIDISNSQNVTDIMRRISSKFDKIDCLINNAASFFMKPFIECDFDDIDTLIDTNLKGAMYVTRATLPMMQNGGRIINIGSVAGEHGIKNQAAYCASKFGLAGFSDVLGQELRDKGINVTLIAPGGIDTPLWQSETNPYPGEKGELLASHEIALLVEYVMSLPQHAIMKKIVIFPSNEWH